MKNIILFSFFFFLLILTGLHYFLVDTSDWNAVFSDKQTIESIGYDENSVTESFGLSIFSNTKPLSAMNLTQYLQENESLEGSLQITNAINQKNEYLIMALVDYKLVPFSVNGSKNNTHIVTLDSMETQLYPFEIENLTAGFHDILILTFLNPNQHSLNREYRISTDFALMGRIRLNALVENNTKPVIEYQHLRKLCNASYPLEGILVNQQPCSPKMWLAENVTAGDKLDYFINIGNNRRQEQRTFAIIQFLDYEQIPLDLEKNDFVYLGKLNNGEKVSIPASLIVPKEKGVHELIVVWILDPYADVEKSPGVRNKEIEKREEPSIRIGLNVE